MSTTDKRQRPFDATTAIPAAATTAGAGSMGSGSTRAGSTAAVSTGARCDADTLWGEHSADLYRFATVLVGPGDAPDIVAVAFRKVMAHVDKGHQLDHPRAYLMRSVRNAAIDAHRSDKRRRRNELRAAVESTVHSTPGPSDDLDLRRAISELSEQQRSVVYFTYWEDLTSAQVADVLGIAAATVRRHLKRARTQLQRTLS